MLTLQAHTATPDFSFPDSLSQLSFLPPVKFLTVQTALEQFPGTYSARDTGKSSLTVPRSQFSHRSSPLTLTFGLIGSACLSHSRTAPACDLGTSGAEGEL